jgi:hypothetical protein
MRRIGQRFRVLQSLFLIMSSIAGSNCYCQDIQTNRLKDVVGTWLLKSVVRAPNIEGPSESEQNKLLGTYVFISNDVIKSCDQSAKIQSVKVSRVSSADFRDQTEASFNDLGIKEASIEAIVINDGDSGNCLGAFPMPGQYLYVVKKDEAIVDFEGVFYRAVRKSVAHTRDADIMLVHQAAYCLASKGFLPHPEGKKSTFGYLVDETSYPGERLLYIVNYPDTPRSDGMAFTILLTSAGGRENFNIQNNASFTAAKNGAVELSFTTPPLGGTWTQQHLASAIKQIEKEPGRTIAVQEMLAIDSSVDCEAYSGASN